MGAVVVLVYHALSLEITLTIAEPSVLPIMMPSKNEYNMMGAEYCPSLLYDGFVTGR
jgi:hypothetical protein